MDRGRVGELVRQRRQAAGLSLRVAAGLSAGTHFSTWQQVETGTLNTTIDTLDDIAKTLKARWDLALLPEEGAAMDPRRRILLDRLASIVDRLDDRDVKSLLAQVAAYEEDLGVQGHSKT
jgi:transcriptional regulator with XRE-family HTH domain